MRFVRESKQATRMILNETSFGQSVCLIVTSHVKWLTRNGNAQIDDCKYLEFHLDDVQNAWLELTHLNDVLPNGGFSG